MAQYANFPAGQILDLFEFGCDVSHRDAAGASVYQYTKTEVDSLRTMNPGPVIGNIGEGNHFVVLFPTPVDVRGVGAVFRAISTLKNAWLQYSFDTTNGRDGSWTSLLQRPYNAPINTLAARTDNLVVTSLSNVAGLRIYGESSTNLYSFNVWVTDVPEGLVAWHATLDIPLSNDDLGLDRGDIFLGTPGVTQQFRVKNTSLTQTADSVTVSCLSGLGGGLLSDETTFSDDDVTYASSLVIPSIAPDTISSVIYMKRALVSDVAGTTRIAMVRAEVGSWL